MQWLVRLRILVLKAVREKRSLEVDIMNLKNAMELNLKSLTLLMLFGGTSAVTSGEC